MASTSPARIHDLPDDVLLSIFSFLPLPDLALCGEVCDRWLTIVKSFTHLWKRKSYVSNRSPSESAETRAVLNALPQLEEVIIEVANAFVVDILYPRLLLSVRDSIALRDCPRLACKYLSTRLDIAGGLVFSESTIDFSALRKLRVLRIATLDVWAPPVYRAECVLDCALRLCPNLSGLCVCADSLSADRLDLLQGIGRLRTLEIECPSLDRLAFLRHCSGALEELHLAGCGRLPSQEYAQLRRLGSLRKLRLSDCRLAEAALAAAAPALACLESLRLSRCGFVRDLSFLRHCPRLRQLCITNAPPPDALLTVAPRGPARLRLRRRPADRSLRVVGVALTLTADGACGALPSLERLGLPASCLDYLDPLHHCPQLRRLCCEFLCRRDELELLNLRVNANLTSSA